MKRPCLILRRWPWFALMLVPALAWMLVLAVVPTDWARTRLVDKLARATGRAVRIGSLRMGLLGDLRIVDLAIADRSTPDDPWLRVGEATIDVHLGQVFCGQCTPRKVRVDGLALRLWRRPDGSSEVGDLIVEGRRPGAGKLGGAAGDPASSMALEVSGASLLLVDDPSGTRFAVSDAHARATWGRRLVAVEELSGRLNGGTLAIAARIDRDPAGPRFEVEAHARGVEIDRGMAALGYFVPVIAGPAEGVGGKLDLKLALKGQGRTIEEARRSLHGNGSVRLDPIDLDDSRFLDQLDVLGDWPKGSRIGSVHTDFTVDRSRILTEELTIRASRFPFILGGWTDFDGRFDYSARVDRIAAMLPREAKGLINELKVNFDQLAGLRMAGSIDHVEVTIHGHPLTGDPDRPDGERARFRETARKIRDRFFR